jgi:PadR family transcriptional regulator, regulatory protein AphA
MSTQLTPTSYLVLGLLAREGPSSPYDLKRRVNATLGHVWSFPHTLLYTEPSRLADLGLVTERRELHGRRRRLFTITDAGLGALRAWLARPSSDPTELRDLGLLQLFFSDLGSAEDRDRLATQERALHRARLARYEEERRLEHPTSGGASVLDRTAERWRSETLKMGILYEQAAVAFWGEVDAGQLESVDGAGRDPIGAERSPVTS